MVDLPPAPGATSPTNWSQFVGQQPPASPEATTPHVAGGISFAAEDAPPNPKQGESRRTDAITEQDVKDSEHNRKLRGTYAEKAYQLAVGCITMWAVMLGTQGAIKALTGVEMWSDKVIIAVTTGVTVSVLAAFLGVIRGLFGNGKDKK